VDSGSRQMGQACWILALCSVAEILFWWTRVGVSGGTPLCSVDVLSSHALYVCNANTLQFADRGSDSSIDDLTGLSCRKMCVDEKFVVWPTFPVFFNSEVQSSPRES
jgi:hypothetical protein